MIMNQLEEKVKDCYCRKGKIDYKIKEDEIFLYEENKNIIDYEKEHSFKQEIKKREYSKEDIKRIFGISAIRLIKLYPEFRAMVISEKAINKLIEKRKTIYTLEEVAYILSINKETILRLTPKYETGIRGRRYLPSSFIVQKIKETSKLGRKYHIRIYPNDKVRGINLPKDINPNVIKMARNTNEQSPETGTKRQYFVAMIAAEKGHKIRKEKLEKKCKKFLTKSKYEKFLKELEQSGVITSIDDVVKIYDYYIKQTLNS